MFIFDSNKKKKVEFKPIKDKEVRIYLCGPTVYEHSHLGHARSAIVFDLLRRVLEKNYYKVIFVRNFTDIDDKILKKLKEEKKDLESLTKYYIQSYKKEMQLLNVKTPEKEPKARKSIDSIEKMIQKLLDLDYAYFISNKDIYFDIKLDNKYFSLSKKEKDSNQHRIDNEKEKRNKEDFILWKAKKQDEDIYFNTSLGQGRPGWHIECSAMIQEHLAYKDEEYLIDIHCGGIDLLFPHHENEAAQSRCINKKELAKYWMHNGFVNINGNKMSKSLNNSFFIKDALKIYHPQLIRFYLLSVHYRADFNFSYDDLKATKKRLDRLFRLKKQLIKEKEAKVNEEFKKELLSALNDDLNTSKALAIIDNMVNIANEKIDKNDKKSKEESLANINFIQDIMGIDLENPLEYFSFTIKENTKETINKLIEERLEAKKNKNYQKADKIRQKLLNYGIKIMDNKEGTMWEIM